MHTLNAIWTVGTAKILKQCIVVKCTFLHCLAEYTHTFPLSFVKAECQDVHTNDQT